MKYTQFKKEEIVEVDLHKMTGVDAMKYLDFLVETLPDTIKEIVVIHGYHGGTVLLNMIRHSYNNKRIKNKYVSLNQGITSLILVWGVKRWFV